MATSEQVKVSASIRDLLMVCDRTTVLMRDEYGSWIALDVQGGEMAGVAAHIPRVVLTSKALDAVLRRGRTTHVVGDDGRCYAIRVL